MILIFFVEFEAKLFYGNVMSNDRGDLGSAAAGCYGRPPRGRSELGGLDRTLVEALCASNAKSMLGIGGHNCFHSVTETVTPNVYRATLAASLAKQEPHHLASFVSFAVRKIVPFLPFGLLFIFIME
jgi:hypothetical protein